MGLESCAPTNRLSHPLPSMRSVSPPDPAPRASPLAPSSRTPRLLLVDGHAYAYRAFHAIRELRSPTGEPTNAIYGFIKMLGRLREVLQPSHLAVVWDGGLAAERMAALPEYKAQRPPMPDGLERQIIDLQRWLAAAGFASFCAEGVEADDWLATLAAQARRAGWRVVIASSDKDFMQLVTPEVGLFNPHDKSETVWGEEHVRAKTGVAPGQIVDWLSLIGDSVDNIPGVPGVGPKTAADLLCRFGSLEGLYARLDEVSSERLRGNLREHAANVKRNQALIRLRDDLPQIFEAAAVAPREAQTATLRELYGLWGFKSLLAQVSAPAQASLL